MSAFVFNGSSKNWVIPAAAIPTVIYGTVAAEHVFLSEGASATLLGFGPGDTLTLPGSTTDYQVHHSGATVYLTHKGGAVVTLPATPVETVLIFSDATTHLKLSVDAGVVNIAGQAITTVGTLLSVKPEEVPVDPAPVHITVPGNTPLPQGDGTDIAHEALATQFTSGYDSTWSYANDEATNSLLAGAAW
ncbi:MAG: hypothetical protein OIF57_11095, partial [Marinobacterium sp.]|nr:hypothetical protein [Marinobacterium sp.]